MRNTGLEETQAGIKISRRNINNLRYADDTTLMAESEEELENCLENSVYGGAWWATVHGVLKSWTRLSDFTFTFHFHALEKEMATHPSVLAWRIPGTEEPGYSPWGRKESDTTQ